jgi:hypothetical protein
MQPSCGRPGFTWIITRHNRLMVGVRRQSWRFSMTTDSSLKSHLAVLLNETAGSKENVAQQLYRYIAADDVTEKAQALQMACMIWEQRQATGDKSPVPNIVSDHDESSFNNNFGDVIDAMVKGLIKQDLPEDQFYDKLWSGVVQNTLLPDDPSRGLALHRVLESKHVPYFYIDTPALKMPNKDFKRKSEELAEEIARIRFILNRPHTQTTEDADLILRIIRSCEKDEDQIVLLAHATSQRVRGMMKDLLGGLLHAVRSDSDG